MSNIEKVPVCEDNHIHNNCIEEVKKTMPDIEKLYDLSELFKVFADSTRIRILYALFEKELCVCELTQILGATQSAISHQLRILKTAKLVSYKKSGKSVIYKLADEHVKNIIGQGMEHIEE